MVAGNTIPFSEIVQSYQAVFTSIEGSIVLQDFARKFGYQRNTTLDERMPDPLIMAFREGQRSLMIHIDTMMTRDADKLREEEENGR